MNCKRKLGNFLLQFKRNGWIKMQKSLFSQNTYSFLKTVDESVKFAETSVIFTKRKHAPTLELNSVQGPNL